MRMKRIAGVSFVSLLLAACGGSKPAPVEPEPVEEEPPPPPPPPPVCVRAGAEMSLIGMVDADANAVKFCVSDGAESNKCYGVDVAAEKYAALEGPPKGQSPVLDPDPARIETTAKEVKVCIGQDCKTFKPKVPKSNENPIDAVVNAAGTYAAVLLGNAERGKGTVELWDVAAGKRIGKPIKYAKGEYKCGEARVLGDTLYVNAAVCSGTDARAWLFHAKGKKIGDVGGKEFGTYGTVPLQISDTTWAFLDENAATIALQDVSTGTLVKTIDIGPLWGAPAPAEAEAPAGEGAAEATPPTLGNPGESALVRGGEGKLVVVTGGPTPGNVGIVDIASGEMKTITALPCEPEPAAEEPAAGEEAAPEATEATEE
jgi:hypothetical protein